jgi:hypothetical protein
MITAETAEFAEKLVYSRVLCGLGGLGVFLVATVTRRERLNLLLSTLLARPRTQSQPQ